MPNRFALALFAYRRPHHLGLCIDSLLQQNQLSLYDIHVFLDGPKPGDNQEAIEDVRKIAMDKLAHLGARFHVQKSNLGLSQSIIRALNKLNENYDAFVVVEDDLLLSSGFLKFMTDGLLGFAGHPRVACIHGYALPISNLPPLYFLRGGDCWGWATWSPKWSLFRTNATALLQEMHDRKLLNEFDQSTGPSQAGLLLDTAMGRRDSWAIRWHASLYLANQLTLHPGNSLVFNTGNDSSGTHARYTRKFDSPISEIAPNIIQASDVDHDEEASRIIRKHFQQQRRLTRFFHQAALKLRIRHWLRTQYNSPT